jgi:hypothetical protein
MTPQKKYSRKVGNKKLAPLSTPSLDDNVKPTVSAKARWADLQGRVSQRSSVKVRLRRQQLENNDFWSRQAANEKLRNQLEFDVSSSDSDDDISSSTSDGQRRKKGGIKVWVHVHDNSYPEAVSDHVTKFALNPPSQTFLFPLGKAKQDFRWLSIGSMRRFTSVYKPRGRIRHREWYVGTGNKNLRAQQIFLNKSGGSADSIGHRNGNRTGNNAKLPPTAGHTHDDINIETAERDAKQLLQNVRNLPHKQKGLLNIQESTPLYKVLKDGDHVWIHFQNGSPTALLAGGSATNMTTVEMFRRTRLHNGLAIAPMPPPEKKIEHVATKKVFKLEESVFSKRAANSDSGSFYDTDEFYNKVCVADLSYCGRLVALVGGEHEYERVKKLLQDNYRCIREAFRYHVAMSRAGNFEMSWLDFSSFAKYCKLIVTEGEHSFGYHDLDNIWVTVNCHQNNDAVDQHHVRFLSRFEFLESLVRIALIKYEGVGAYAAVEHLLNAHIVPYFKHLDANVFRRQKLYSPSTAKVFELFKPSLKLAFREYAVNCKVMQIGVLSLTRDEFTAMLEAARLMTADNHGLTRKTVHRLFVTSQNTVLDEHQRSRRASLRDDNKTMSFEELMEALARSADEWETSSENFEIKLTRFLQALCAGLSL